MFEVKQAKRLGKLPPYLFDELDKAKRRLASRGVTVIDLGVGDPDLPTPPAIVEGMREAVRNPSHHKYPGYSGSPRLKQALALWFEGRFGVRLDPDSEILVLIGSKEGLGHLPLALVDEGERVLVPDPGYPVYSNMSVMIGADVCPFSLREADGFLPRTDELDSLGKAKLLFLNYPNNPTGAVADAAFYQRLIDFATSRGIMVCNDAAYSEVTFEGFRSPSIMAARGAAECAIEIHSFSKTFNMTGWRIGFAVGNREILRALAGVKVNLDSSVFGAIQEAAAAALSLGHSEHLGIYEKRRNAVFEKLSRMNCHFFRSPGTFYVWAKAPGGVSSVDFAVHLLEKIGVAVAPGSGFGRNGEGWFRIALTRPDEEISRGLDRMAGLNLWTS